jgi:hypothetical protein
MGTGYTRNDSSNNIADGNVINASDLDGEFDAVQAAFNASTGHSHDGTTGEGPQIATAGIANGAVTSDKVANNAVALGTKTTGNYVATVAAGEGIDVSGSGSETAAVTVSAEIATTSNRGVASFNSSDFSVSSGAVSLAKDPVITLDGDVSGSATMTNLGSATITTTVANDSHTHDGRYFTETESDARYCLESNNLSDLTNASTARSNLGLGSLATLSSVTASQIDANAVGASELNVSGNGTTSQFLRSDGDGTFTWATPTDTNTTYSAGTNLSLSGTTFNVSSNPSFTDVYVDDQILSTGDTDTYMQFHAANQWRVVTGGSERLEVNDSQVTIANGLTVSNGDITLSGTGRIQGVDTVSSSTDAANKAYVDNALSGVSSSVADGCIYENAQTISSNYTMTTNYSGHSVGPITINTGVTVTIPTGSNWVVS